MRCWQDKKMAPRQDNLNGNMCNATLELHGIWSTKNPSGLNLVCKDIEVIPHNGRVPVLRNTHKENGALVLNEEATYVATRYLIRRREAQHTQREGRQATLRLLEEMSPDLVGSMPHTLDRLRAWQGPRTGGCP